MSADAGREQNVLLRRQRGIVHRWRRQKSEKHIYIGWSLQRLHHYNSSLSNVISTICTAAEVLTRMTTITITTLAKPQRVNVVNLRIQWSMARPIHDTQGGRVTISQLDALAGTTRYSIMGSDSTNVCYLIPRSHFLRPCMHEITKSNWTLG